MERNRTIDLMRFAAAVFVLFIHVNLFKNSPPFVYHAMRHGLFRTAVPFFFICSGFFYQLGLQRGKPLGNYYKKLFSLWGLASALQLLVSGRYYFLRAASRSAFLRDLVFTGLSGHYWFFPSLIASLLLLTPFFKRRRLFVPFLFGTVLYFTAMTHDGFSFLFTGTLPYRLMERHIALFRWTCSGLTLSLFFLTTGAFIALHREKLCGFVSNHRRSAAASALLLTCLLMLEGHFTQARGAYDSVFLVTLLPLPALLFVLALAFDPVRFGTRRFGTASLYVYVIHPVVLDVFRRLPFSRGVRVASAAALSLILSFLAVFLLERSGKKSREAVSPARKEK